MKTYALSIMTAAMAWAVTSGIAYAAPPAHSNAGGNGKGKFSNVASVPEIDAASGILALAAVAGLLAMFYELRRRRDAA